jgi:hypothetical protein
MSLANAHHSVTSSRCVESIWPENHEIGVVPARALFCYNVTMPRTGAVLLEREPLLAAAVIAAQATLESSGFRQRDVRFFLELFSNWLQSTTGSWTLSVHNTQVQRALELDAKVGWAKRIGRTPPRYRLTPEGLVELLRRMVQRKNLARLDEFFLVFHILDAYGVRLRGLVEHSGMFASKTLALDVNELIDPRKLVLRERASVAREIERLSLRIDESRQTSALTRKLLHEKRPLGETIAAVQRRFPYELNSQKPLTELLEDLPVPWRRAEVEEIAEQRASSLWQPTRELLVAYDRILAGLIKPSRPVRSPP